MRSNIKIDKTVNCVKKFKPEGKSKNGQARILDPDSHEIENSRYAMVQTHFFRTQHRRGRDVCTQIGAISGRDSFEALQMGADCREQSMAHGLIIGIGP